jgi:hypothetical protein
MSESTALRLADALNCATDDDCGYCQPCVIAAELRRLHALNGELLEALRKCSAQLTRLGYSANHADAILVKVEGQA